VQAVSWDTVKVLLAMLMVPDLAGPELIETEYFTVPFPVPLAPEVMVIHEALLVAVQGQTD